MRNRIYCKLILIFGVCLLSGCQGIPNIGKPEASDRSDKPEEKGEVRAAFKQDDKKSEDQKSDPGNSASGAITASEETFDYVALGNSVTCSEAEGSIWWGDGGMPATTAEQDYVHLISAELKEKTKKPVTTMILDLKKWELAKDRNRILKKYTAYFDENTDLITIQTGENITEFKETLNTDYMALVKVIKEKAPNAQIIMLGELLWPSEDIEAAKKAACETYDVTFLEMTEFLDDYNDIYRSEIGGVVTGEDGKQHIISDEAVAAHPNDKGMACIARLVMEQVSVQN